MAKFAYTNAINNYQDFWCCHLDSGFQSLFQAIVKSYFVKRLEHFAKWQHLIYNRETLQLFYGKKWIYNLRSRNSDCLFLFHVRTANFQAVYCRSDWVY